MKRFWDKATVVAEDDGGFSVRLDGRPVRLPSGAIVQVSALVDPELLIEVEAIAAL